MKKGCCLTVLLAWVLWYSSVGKTGKHTQSPQDSFETLKECNAKKHSVFQTRKALDEKYFIGRVKIGDESITRYDKKGGFYSSSSYRCLPDTIDPRPRK